MRPLVIVAIMILLLPSPHPPAAAASDEIPAWVPITVIGTTIVAGILYLGHRARDREAAESKSPQERALDLVAYISTPEERAELQAIAGPKEIDAFLDRFFSKWDPTPRTAVNEFRREYERRFRFANARFSEHRESEGWRSDRGRIYIIYGAPQEVQETSDVSLHASVGAGWKSAEFWEYARPAGANPLPPVLLDPGLFQKVFHLQMPARGRMLFIFADHSGASAYRQVFSTEPGEKTDSDVYTLR